MVASDVPCGLAFRGNRVSQLAIPRYGMVTNIPQTCLIGSSLSVLPGKSAQRPFKPLPKCCELWQVKLFSKSRRQQANLLQISTTI
jgi:hypothetical protein